MHQQSTAVTQRLSQSETENNKISDLRQQDLNWSSSNFQACKIKTLLINFWGDILRDIGWVNFAGCISLSRQWKNWHAMPRIQLSEFYIFRGAVRGLSHWGVLTSSCLNVCFNQKVYQTLLERLFLRFKYMWGPKMFTKKINVYVSTCKIETIVVCKHVLQNKAVCSAIAKLSQSMLGIIKQGVGKCSQMLSKKSAESIY